MKAVLSDRIYMKYTDKLYEHVKENLTYKIPSRIPGDPPQVIKNFSIMHNRLIIVPIGRIDLIPKEYEIIDKRVQSEIEFPEFNFKLRDSQQNIYDLVEDNCLINANPSWGKTFTGIAIAKKLKQKTLVICHTVHLRDQWVGEVEKTLKIKPGIIGSGKFDHNKPITIANVQTLRKHVDKLKNEFGTVILDEVHHAPATIFEQSVQGMKARYKIGLSATLRRKDYMHVMIPDFFSKKIYKAPKENQMKPKIVMIRTDIPFNSNNMIPWAKRVNELVSRPKYKDVVTSVSEHYANEGHKVLVVSDRTEFLDSCANISGERSVMIYGSTKNRDELHKKLENDICDILYGALSIYKEGISLNYLSCLVLAAQINNDPMLEQLIGRVQREHPNKLEPLIIDIVLKGAAAKKQSQSRAAYYMSQGYKIEYIDLR